MSQDAVHQPVNTVNTEAVFVVFKLQLQLKSMTFTAPTQNQASSVRAT